MKIPVVWTIAGTDPSGGAGIQADLKTMMGLGVYGCSVITSVIAQNTMGVYRVEPVSPDMLTEQLAALRTDVPPDVIKLGVLGTADHIRIIAQFLRELDPKVKIVCDPVLAPSDGKTFMSPEGLTVFISDLLPRVDLLTPNLPEAAAIAGHNGSAAADIETAAARILQLGAKSVFVKGGHAEGPYCRDFWSNGAHSAWLFSPRRDVTHTHGTGCTLSSAIASALALGYSERDAIVIAKAYVNQGLRLGGGIGHGRGPLHHGRWPSIPEDLPGISASAEPDRAPAEFPDRGPAPIGFYPIVDRAAWLPRLLPLGVRTIQLRAKDLSGPALENEIVEAIRYARQFDARLYINDEWRLALKHGAYGVHLGQEDMAQADLSTLAKARLRLGLSACSYYEMAQALAKQPTYIAIGPVFATPSKQVDYPPLGVAGFLQMRTLSSKPVVAIGGISLERGAEIIDAGADGIAVISDIVNSRDLPERVSGWLSIFRK